MKKLLIVISLGLFLSACSLKDGGQVEETQVIEDSNITLTEEEMTLEEKIGQLVIMGVEGSFMTDETAYKIEKYKPGGIILFSKNISSPIETKKFIKSLQKINKSNSMELFIGIDEEGGRVSRIPEEYVKIPNAFRLGKEMNGEEIYEIGKIQGERLKRLGVNLNFAPVLDIRSNEKNKVIGDRAFGRDPKTVIERGIPMAMGIRDGHVLPVVKHFPGHGGTEEDSHFVGPVMKKSKEELYEFDMEPFRKAIEEGVEGIMVSHVLYQELDSKFPASMSEIIMKDILRDELGFTGLIFSDDMTMGAIKDSHGILEGAYEFIISGGDMVLLCHETGIVEDFIEKMKEGVLKGDILEKEIDEKLERIKRAKKAYIDEKDYDLELNRLNNELKKLLD